MWAYVTTENDRKFSSKHFDIFYAIRKLQTAENLTVTFINLNINDLGKIGIDFQIPKLNVLSWFKTQACKNWSQFSMSSK
jgi:hypothetical protein